MRRTLEPGANFGQVQPQLCHGAAQRIAVHAQFFRRFALVPPVRHQNLAELLLLEFPNGVFEADAAGVHLGHQAVQFSSHASLLLISIKLV